MVSVRTDVYAYGITLIQLISGRKAVSSNSEDSHQSLRQWVCLLGLCIFDITTANIYILYYLESHFN